MKRQLFLTGAMVTGLLFGASTAYAGSGSTTTVDANASEWSSDTLSKPLNGIYPIRGNGQLNGDFVVAKGNDIEIALRVTDRTDGLLDVSGNEVGRYEASTGYDGNTTNRAEWNYDWHVDLRGSGTTLADYNLILSTDIGNPLWGQSGAIDLVTADAPSGIRNAVLYQRSMNPVFGNPGFDVFAEDTYNIRLTLRPKAGGSPLSVKVQVTVSDPA